MKKVQLKQRQRGSVSFETLASIVAGGILAAIAIAAGMYVMNMAKANGLTQRVNSIYSTANVFRNNNGGSYTGVTMAILQSNAYAGSALSGTNNYGGTTTVSGTGATLTITEPGAGNDCDKVSANLNGSNGGWTSSCSTGTLTASVSG